MTNNDAKIFQGVPIDVKLKLSASWVAMMFLYIYADMLSLFRPGQLDEMREGLMGPFQVTQVSLVSASILVIIPAIMVYVSLTLKPRVNRWTNIALGALYTVVTVSNLVSETWAYYVIFGILEVMITFLIVWYA
jgi:hypothetical protein